MSRQVFKSKKNQRLSQEVVKPNYQQTSSIYTSQVYQSSVPPPPHTGSYIQTPMPPPATQTSLYQQSYGSNYYQQTQENNAYQCQNNSSYIQNQNTYQSQNNEPKSSNQYINQSDTHTQEPQTYETQLEQQTDRFQTYLKQQQNPNCFNQTQKQEIQNTHSSTDKVQSEILPQADQFLYSSTITQSCEPQQSRDDEQQINSQQILDNEYSFLTKSLERSKIITNSKIKELDINPNTHNMILIEENQCQFEVKPFDEKFKKEKYQNKQLVNSNYIIIQNNQTKIPEFQLQERLCQIHGKKIDKICANQECKDNNDLLLCKDCAREHKGHVQYDIQEALFLIQKSTQMLEKNDTFIETIKSKALLYFKNLKSNIMKQLQDIENQIQQGFDGYKQQLIEKKTNYQDAFNSLQDGGLSNMIQYTNYIYNEGLFKEDHLNSNQEQYLQLVSYLQQVKLSLKKFEDLIEQEKQEFVKIKINNAEMLIESQKVQDLNDFYYQIKIGALKQKITNIVDQELLLLQKNVAIKLKGNDQKIDLKKESDIQIISYQEI